MNRWTRGAMLSDEPVIEKVNEVQLPSLERGSLNGLLSMPFTDRVTRRKTYLAVIRHKKWLKIKNDPVKHAAKKARMKRYQIKNREILNERKRKFYAAN